MDDHGRDASSVASILLLGHQRIEHEVEIRGPSPNLFLRILIYQERLELRENQMGNSIEREKN